MPTIVLLWIWICAYLNCAGWVLSAAHELNAPAYAAVLLAGLVFLLIWQKRSGIHFCRQFRWPCLHRRFRRLFPLAFLILAGLAFLGGTIHAPNNYDALSYRVPRVLHWLAAGQWQWIHTIFPRLNARACGIEWVSAPLLSLTGSDRLLFLTNIVSFLLLPGLIYSVFTRLGVRRRAAWHWMWIVPSGYCFAVQAGSIGNDLFGAPFALAAVDFALRAKNSQSRRDFFTSILAAALLTGAKSSSLPLLLPWALAILPCWRLCFRQPVQLAAVCLLALSASFFPNALLNAHYARDWTGTKSETTGSKTNPALQIPVNLALLAVQNLTPPVFPLAGTWNHMVKVKMPTNLSLELHQVMVEPGAAEFKVEEMQIEESAGVGFGVSLLLIFSLITALWLGGGSYLRNVFNFQESPWLTVLRLAPLISLLVLISQSQIGAISRVITPYYALILPVFLVGPAQEQVVKRCWWRALAVGVFLLAALLLFISPARPLFPAETILSNLKARHPKSQGLERAAEVYSVYHQRNAAFAPVLAALPPETEVLGLFTYDDPEASLWHPLGHRKIEHVRPEDTAEDLRQRGIHYVLIPPEKLRAWFNLAPEDWLHRLNATVVQKIPLNLRASEGATDWWLVKLP